MLKAKYDELTRLIEECDEEEKLYEIIRLASDRVDTLEEAEAEEEENGDEKEDDEDEEDDGYEDAVDMVIVDNDLMEE